MQPHVVDFFKTSSRAGPTARLIRIALAPMLYLLLLSLVVATKTGAAERFFISIPGPTLSYVPLYYGQEKGFFAQEGLDLQVLVVRGIIGVSSLMSGEIDVTCHAAAAFRRRCAGFP